MIQQRSIQRVIAGKHSETLRDDIAVEEPLEIRVQGKVLAVIMRTPGHDRELTAGWLLSEGIIRGASDIADIVFPPNTEHSSNNMVDVLLANPEMFRPEMFSRHVMTSSSCGICGSVALEAAMQVRSPLVDDLKICAETLMGLPALLEGHQPTFERTGGIHACALFNEHGHLLAIREDVGRHNALDKLTGWALLEGKIPLSEHVLLLSGRVSFEMTQKAFVAGIALVAAIGAPTSLAVDLAARTGQTLVAFLKAGSLNIYHGAHRLG